MIPVTSNRRTSRRSFSTSRPSSVFSFVLSRSLLAVVTTGKSVVLSKCLAKWKPMPREAGDTRVHGFDIFGSKMGTCFSKASGKLHNNVNNSLDASRWVK